MTKGQTPVHMDMNKALEGIAPSLVKAPFEKGECARCGLDNHAWKFCQKSIVASLSQGKRPTPQDDHPNDVSSVAGAAGSEPKTQVSASRPIYEVDSKDEMIIEQRVTVVKFYDIEVVVLSYLEKWGGKQ